MQRLIRGISCSGLVLALFAASGTLPSQARTAGVTSMVVHLRVSGDLHYNETLTHVEDASYAIPSTFSCVRFTHPNFPIKGKPLAYALSFDNPDVLGATAGVFFSFFYNPSKLSGQHVDGAGESLLLAVPAKNVAFGPGGVGTYTIVEHLAPDLRSGSVTATNLRNLLGAGHVNIQLTWSCPALFVRPT